MKREKMAPKRWVECDGCQYQIGLTRAERDEGADIESRTTVLRVPTEHGDGPSEDDGFLEFHFHGPNGSRHDCFRYWANSPDVMKRSLKERGWEEEQIDKFMATHLYRPEGQTFGPGMTRPKVNA